MYNYSEHYDMKPAAAWIRGHALSTGYPALAVELLDVPLEVLTDDELQTIVETGKKKDLGSTPSRTENRSCPGHGGF